MKSQRLWPACAWLLLCSTPALAVDLTQIDRTIAKEPTYQSKFPQYCLLVFGPEAKTRVWLVLDGDILYVDRNGNGDLTDEGERVVKRATGWFEAGDIVEADGKTRHTNLKLIRSGKNMHLRMRLEGKQEYPLYPGHAMIRFGDRPAVAPILHFRGPRTLGLCHPEEFRRGQDNHVLVRIGTPGLGEGSFVEIGCQDMPRSASLVAEIEFPSNSPTGKSIQTRVNLTYLG